MGMLKYMTGQLEEAYPLLDEAARVAGQCGYVRIQTNALISLGDLLTDLNDLESAFACYDQALTQASHLGHSLYIFYASLGEARLKRLGGDIRQAMEDLQQVEISQIRLGSFERAFFNLELGHCLMEDGRLEEATGYFTEAADLFGDGGNQAEEQVARFWQAVLQWYGSSHIKAGQMASQIPPQREWRTPTPLMINARQAAVWLKKKQPQLLKEPDVRLFFEHAIRLLNHLSDLRTDLPGSVEHESARPRLEIISFGGVQVFHDGRLVELSDWQTREARDLFIYLLQSPPLTKEQIAMDFWPDLSPARIKTRFKINIFRIRQALGQDVILFRNDQYAFNRSLSYTWDRERLDTLLQASSRRTVLQERIDLLEQTLALFKGQYLEEVEAFWAEADRIRYRDMQRDAMLNLAELYLRKSRAQDCMQLIQQLLKLDPLLESAHRLVLKACAAQHDPAGLSRKYHEYQKILEDELGMLPSVEMRALYEKLLAEI
jgi:DNA-binding SARP family transcriptional activator